MKKLILFLTTIFAGLTANAQNIALNKTVTCSSLENNYYSAKSIVDGNLNTRWSSSFSDNQWIQVDLGNAYNLTGCNITWEDSKAKSYTIQISNDATKWTTIYTYSNNSSATNNLSLTGSGRYIRINCLIRSDKYGFSIWEFEVYGALAGNCNYTPYQNTIDSFKTVLTAVKNTVTSVTNDNNKLTTQINKLVTDTGLYKAQVRVYKYMLDTVLIANNKLRLALSICNDPSQLDTAQLNYFKKLPLEYVTNDGQLIYVKKTWTVVPWFKLQSITRRKNADGTMDEYVLTDLSK